MRIKAFFIYVFVCMFFACEQNPRYVLPEKAETETDAKRPGIETQREDYNEVSEKEKTVKSPVIEPVAETEKETVKPKEPKVLKPIVEYPAYIFPAPDSNSPHILFLLPEISRRDEREDRHRKRLVLHKIKAFLVRVTIFKLRKFFES